MQFLTLAIYFAILAIITFISRKKVKNLSDFYLGGRNIGGWMTAFAYGTTYFSAVMFVGYAGRLGFSLGISVIWIGIANAVIGSLLAWILLAKPTKKMTHRLSVDTMASFFAKRYNTPWLKIFAAIVVFVFLVPYSASVYQGLSYLFESTFNIPFEYCVIVMAGVTLIYLLVGGYIASSLLDFFQAIVMVVGVVVLIGFVLGSPVVGGLSEGVAKIATLNADKATLFPPSGIGMPLIYMIILTSLGTWGLPQMVHKFYAIKDDAAIKRGTIVSTIFCLLIAGGTYFIGSFGQLFTNGAPPIDPVTLVPNADMIMPQMVSAALPEAWVGIIIVLVLAASMSTLSSLVLASSSAISIDLVKGYIKKDMSQKSTLTLMRVMCAVFVIISAVVALNKVTAILTLMSFSWGAISGCFLGAFLYGVRAKWVTKAGAISGMILGLGTTLVLALVLGLDTTKSPMIGSIAMGVSLVSVPLVSLFTKKFDKAFIDEVFEDKVM